MKPYIQMDASGAIADLAKLSADSQKALRQLVATTGLAIHKDAKTSIQRGTRTGVEYRRGRKLHRASAPGEPPKTDRGGLVNSIKVITRPLYSVVGSSLDYSLWLEIGTATIKPRPWLMPAVERHRKAFEDGVRKIVG